MGYSPKPSARTLVMSLAPAAMFALSLAVPVSGCSGESPAEPSDTGTDASGMLPLDDAGEPVSPDASSSHDAAGVDADAGNAVNPVSLCPVPTMDKLYSGFLPPNPYGAITAADTCINKRHDGLIVLGCPNNSDGTPATCQITRADMAVAFRKAGFGDKIITSGAAAHNAYVEADTLKQLLIERGVAAADIVTEPKAMHTDENLYFSSLIMKTQGWTNAIVISDDPGHLILSATCDSNCCVDLGRLTALDFNVAGSSKKAAHYVLFPWAEAVAQNECSTIQFPAKAMCTNLGSRLACAGNLKVDAGP